jgi:hypothetical protein
MVISQKIIHVNIPQGKHTRVAAKVRLKNFAAVKTLTEGDSKTV